MNEILESGQVGNYPYVIDSGLSPIITVFKRDISDVWNYKSALLSGRDSTTAVQEIVADSGSWSI